MSVERISVQHTNPIQNKNTKIGSAIVHCAAFKKIHKFLFISSAIQAWSWWNWRQHSVECMEYITNSWIGKSIVHIPHSYSAISLVIVYVHATESNRALKCFHLNNNNTICFQFEEKGIRQGKKRNSTIMNNIEISINNIWAHTRFLFLEHKQFIIDDKLLLQFKFNLIASNTTGCFSYFADETFLLNLNYSSWK